MIAQLLESLGLRTRAAEARAAEARWRDFNRRQLERGCPCGKPAVTTMVSTYGQVGSVAPAFARCAEHADVPLTVPWGGVEGHLQPLVGGDRDHCRWRHRLIGGPVSECECGTHVGEAR